MARANLGSLLLGLACPPLYLWHRGRGVGVLVLGLVWAASVILAGMGLYAMARYPVLWEHFLLLHLGLETWLISGLLAWLWGWRPFLGGMAFWLLVLALILTSLASPSSLLVVPPSVPPGPIGFLRAE
jgi:hypothetical protein